MPYEFQNPLEVSDFSGGITDNYIDCQENQYEYADNYLIQKNKKLISRDGISLYDETYYQLPSGNQRIGLIIKHRTNDKLFFQSGSKISKIDSELTGPTGNSALPGTATSNRACSSEWKNHSIVSCDSFCNPVKIYKDENGAYKMRTLGLPALDLVSAISVANDLRTKYTAHRADAAQHTSGVDNIHTISSTAATDYDSLITLVSELAVKYQAHDADALLGSSWAFHAAQESPSNALSSTTAPTTLAEAITLLTDIRTKYAAHDANATTHAVGSSHQPSASITFNPTVSTGGALTFLYAFTLKHTYKVDDVEFEVESAITQITAASAVSGTKTISNIPVLVNGTTLNYDTTNVKIAIYRTVAAGAAFFYVGEVTNGTTTFSDTVSDANLVLNPSIYTNGGELENDAPPPSKYFTVANNQGFMAHVKEGSVVYPNRIRISKPDNLDSWPASLTVDFDTEITGISQVNMYPIVFSRERIYRLEGTYDATGAGTPKAWEITRTDGCISNQSIVPVPGGLVFAGNDGFFFTDGYSVTQITAKNLVSTYKDLVATSAQEIKIYGRMDTAESRVYWTVQRNGSSADNDAIFVLDLTWGLSEQCSFTTFSSVNSWNATSIEMFNGEIIIGDRRGYVFKFDPNSLSDMKINTATAPTTWDTSAIIWDFKGMGTSFGTSTLYKFTPSLTVQAKNQTNVSIGIKVNSEDSGYFKDLKEVRFRENITWGDPDITWSSTSSSSYPWNVARLIKALRFLPHGSLRAIYKQVQITNSYTIIYNSDSVGLVSVDGDLKKVTLLSGTWPADIVDYYISFVNDSYQNQFQITVRDSDTVATLSDPSNLLITNASRKWQISGYKKDEQLNLLSYSINYAFVGQKQDVYRGVTGANA